LLILFKEMNQDLLENFRGHDDVSVNNVNVEPVEAGGVHMKRKARMGNLFHEKEKYSLC
jgi:hypothetical protein